MSDEETPLCESAIDKLISDAQQSTAQQSQNVFTREDMVSLTYHVGELLQSVKKIVGYPSKFVMSDCKQSSDDANLVAAINDPYVTMALRLQQSYATGQLELFEQLMEFAATKRFVLKEDNVVKRFNEECAYYLPLLPKVRDEELEKKAWGDVEPSEELYSVGRSEFMSIVNDLLYIRFGEQDIMEDVMTYVSAKHTASKWATLYQLWDEEQDEEVSGVTPDECFFQYVGAVAMSNFLDEHREQLRSFVSVLIEPILTQFEEKDVVSETARDELRAVMPGPLYDHIHTTTHEKEEQRRFMVHLYGGDGALLVGVGVGSTPMEAESRAAAVAMYKKTQLDRAIRNVQGLIRERSGAVQEESTSARPAETPMYANNNGYGTQYDMSGAPAPPPPMAQAPHGYAMPPSHTPPMGSEPQSNMMRAPPPGQLVNQDYQRQKEEDQQSIALAPMVEDDALVDKSSKQKLNEMLINMRYAAAEYKTSKLSNSDVQVVCYIENIPIARAISTNKKKAGHVCAQYVLGNWRYFFSFLPARN